MEVPTRAHVRDVMQIRYPQPGYAIRNANTLSAMGIRYPQREYAIRNGNVLPMYT